MKKQISIIVICLMSMFTSTAQTWSAVGSGLNGTVNSLYNDSTSNRLYATGAFTGRVAYWNGTTWNVIPGFPGTFDGLSIATHGTDLIVGSDSIYVWTGSNWYTVSGIGATTILGGYGFTSACWYPPCAQNGFNDYFYVSGKYSGNNSLVQCDPSNSYAPTPLGPNLTSYNISDLEVYNNALYMTGNWPGYIVRYTTSLTNVPSTFVASNVTSAKTYSGNIYFSGGFNSFNGISSPNFIKYNATSFLTTGGASTINPGVMESYSGNLYMAFNLSPGMKVWNGTTLTNISSPIGQTVKCVAVYHGELFAGGNFTTPYLNVAKYNANPALVLSQTHTNVSCNGGNNGTATCSVSGGLPSYNYSWSPGSYTTASISGLTAGTYTCVVTDAATMVQTITVTITQPSIISATQNQSNVSCNGGTNGSATLVVSGGTPIYTYSWSPSGGTSATASGLTSGVYTCLITDANSCTSTKTFTITQPTSLVATTSSTNESGPSMNDGSTTVNPSGGTSPYTYSWSPSGQTTQTATGLTGGVYNCTITDNNGCTTIKTVTVTTTITTGVSSYTLPVVTIYPNPSNGQFTIDAGEATINVIDCLGQICLHFTINSKQSINLDKPGMYLVQVIKDGKIYNSRLINQ